MARVALLAGLSLCVGACGGRVAGGSAADASVRADVVTVVPSYTDASPPLFDATALPTCEACTDVACADLLAQCGQESGCNAVLECMISTRDADTCLCDGTSDAVDHYLALARCRTDVGCKEGSCASLCARDAGFQCSSPLPACVTSVAASSTATCDACVTRACASFAAACGAASECQTYLACVATCRGDACATECAGSAPLGQTQADALDVCLGTSCSAECSF